MSEKQKKVRKQPWFKTQKEFKTKGYIKKTEIFSKKDKKTYSLNEIKDLCKTYDNYVLKNKGSKYFIRAINEYGERTIREDNGTWYDEDDNYYNSRAYDKDKFEKFYQYQIVYTKPT
jgi:hypothetical protein